LHVCTGLCNGLDMTLFARIGRALTRGGIIARNVDAVASGDPWRVITRFGWNKPAGRLVGRGSSRIWARRRR
jgi:hypothetical protein